MITIASSRLNSVSFTMCSFRTDAVLLLVYLFTQKVAEGSCTDLFAIFSCLFWLVYKNGLPPYTCRDAVIMGIVTTIMSLLLCWDRLPLWDLAWSLCITPASLSSSLALIRNWGRVIGVPLIRWLHSPESNPFVVFLFAFRRVHLLVAASYLLRWPCWM